ncbi:type IV pilin protein [Vibrio sp. AK197]
MNFLYCLRTHRIIPPLNSLDTFTLSAFEINRLIKQAMRTFSCSKHSGFTLIELMIVVAIIGILSSIAVPAYQHYVKKAEMASALSMLKSLLTPAELYYQQHGAISSEQSNDIWQALGTSASASSLGTLSIEDDGFAFAFDNSAITTGTRLLYSRAANGWFCTTFLGEGESADIIASSCPESQP